MIHTCNFNSPRNLRLLEVVYFNVTRKSVKNNRSYNNSMKFNSVPLLVGANRTLLRPTTATAQEY
jgi:hypothetical protein